MSVLPMVLRPLAAEPHLLPTDDPRVSASGPDPHQLLLLGAEASLLHGVRCHGLGVAGQLARRMPPFTGHGADVEVVPMRRLAASALDRGLHGRDVAHVDAAVVVAGPAPLRRGSANRLRDLLAELCRRLPAGVPVVAAIVTGDPSPQALLRSAVPADVVLVELPEAAPGRPSDTYAAWAGAVARGLAPHVGRAERRSAPVDEPRRQAAVNRLAGLDLSRDDELGRIVASARAGYGTRYAALSVIDADRTRFSVRQGFELEEIDRYDSFCASALHERRGLLVRDARSDPAFRSLPSVQDGTDRFYAGHPVEGPDGQPVAVLCVFDPEPRSDGTDDLVLLRDLAVAARRRLFDAAAGR
ncbi:GAF domain-containing protein [Amnibacterium sp. CER49]|uniref:GAF domain-containing protein n=1 Tax=Amnibacterium sp. CER49 TaxID=3039161 RepID=UPI00244CBD85|nr:GAF domain-containing protein [Amnibacterium sp. CER49]MDH2443387.1 GAF domain-containing protein [Amnibacterium sp. CER49]